MPHPSGEKNARIAPAETGLEPGTYRVLDEGPPQLSSAARHGRLFIYIQAGLSVAKDRVGRLRNTACCVF